MKSSPLSVLDAKHMYSIKPYIIVPTLIEQPTWGGSYITSLKGLSGKQWNHKKIGQSYELFRDSHLSLKNHTLHNPSVDLAQADDPGDPERFYDQDTPFSIGELIVEDPKKVLGEKVLQEHGHSVEIMIKFTQAKGNSYQVHSQSETENWLPKPESWYFFEKGLATLGLNPKTDWQEYKRICGLIYKEAQLISKAVVQEILTLEEGKKSLAELIEKHNPQDYVNLIQVSKNSAIDLSSGGIHHSWEENPQTHPHGNILYEVQKNVYDPDCTIRSFDKGKIKENGSIRELHLDDYFLHIDKHAQANDPEKYYKKGQILKKTSTQTIKQIFETPDYSLQELTISSTVSNQFTTTSSSFHHLFVRQGTLELKVKDSTWKVSQGFSIFIPASMGIYRIRPINGRVATVLKTYL